MKTAALALFMFVSSTSFALSVKDLFGPLQGQNDSICYVRKYSSADLASHAKQTVRQMKVKLKESDGTPLLQLQVLRKSDKRTYHNTMACFDYKGRVMCSVDCDGGSVEIVGVYPDFGIKLKNNNVLLYGGCGEEEADGSESETIILDAKAGGDDVFRLYPADPRSCGDMR